jgi:RNA polymerase sigma factor (sigma-70 family)
MSRQDRQAPPVPWEVFQRERARLIGLARHCGARPEDAEDIVSEAMLRVAVVDDLDVERLPALLSAVVRNLTVDRHRATVREQRLRQRIAGRETFTAPDHGEAVCDRDAARWVARRIRHLNGSQRAVLVLKADGMSVGEVARHLGLRYKAVENALHRGRTTLRAAARGALVVAGIVGVRARRPSLQTAVVLPVAMVGAVLLLPAPWQHDAGNGRPQAEVLTAAPIRTSPGRPLAVTKPRIEAVRRNPVGRQEAVVPVRRVAPASERRTPRVLAEAGAAPAPGVLDRGGITITREETGKDFLTEVTDCITLGPSLALDSLGCPPR